MTMLGTPLFFALFGCCFFVTNGLFGSENFCRHMGEVHVYYQDYYRFYLGRKAGTTEFDETGRFVKNLRHSVAECCPNLTVKFILDNRTNQERFGLKNLRRYAMKKDKNLTFFFPVFVKERQVHMVDYGLEYVALYHSPGHALIMRKREDKSPMSIIQIFVELWQMLLFLLVLSWVIGILGWMADHWKNPDEFPGPFVVGMFEGFWWSTITMTTVGYGDKAPKSVPARMLAVCWVLVSAVLLSLFTANATSILNASQEQEDYTITRGKKIGVFRSKSFVELNLNFGGEITGASVLYLLNLLWLPIYCIYVECPDVLKGITMLKNKSIDLMLFPHFLDFLLLHTDEEYTYAVQDFEVAKVMDLPFQIGMTFAKADPNKHEQSFLKCLRFAIAQGEEQDKDSISHKKVIWPKLQKEEIKGALDTGRLLDLAYYCLALGIFLMFFGISWDLWKQFQKKRKLKKKYKGA